MESSGRVTKKVKSKYYSFEDDESMNQKHAKKRKRTTSRFYDDKRFYVGFE